MKTFRLTLASRTIAFASLVGTISLGGACSAIVDATATQCRSQQDCLGRGPEFVDTTCSAERVCVKIEAAVQACKTNQECVDQNGGA